MQTLCDRGLLQRDVLDSWPSPRASELNMFRMPRSAFPGLPFLINENSATAALGTPIVTHLFHENLA